MRLWVCVCVQLCAHVFLRALCMHVFVFVCVLVCVCVRVCRCVRVFVVCCGVFVFARYKYLHNHASAAFES